MKGDLAARIDHALDYLAVEWTGIPEVAAEWESRNELDRLDFVLEWPIREDRFDQLRTWEAKGQLSASQQERLAKLKQLIERNRATVDRLLAN